MFNTCLVHDYFNLLQFVHRWFVCLFFVRLFNIELLFYPLNHKTTIRPAQFAQQVHELPLSIRILRIICSTDTKRVGAFCNQRINDQILNKTTVALTATCANHKHKTFVRVCVGARTCVGACLLQVRLYIPNQNIKVHQVSNNYKHK